VALCEEKRNFGLGITLVRHPGNHSGRGWKDQLCADAVAALHDVLAN
jgi:hypothetical protein